MISHKSVGWLGAGRGSSAISPERLFSVSLKGWESQMGSLFLPKAFHPHPVDSAFWGHHRGSYERFWDSCFYYIPWFETSQGPFQIQGMGKHTPPFDGKTTTHLWPHLFYLWVWHCWTLFTELVELCSSCSSAWLNTMWISLPRLDERSQDP